MVVFVELHTTKFKYLDALSFGLIWSDTVFNDHSSTNHSEQTLPSSLKDTDGDTSLSSVWVNAVLWCGFCVTKPQVSTLCSVHASTFAFWWCNIRTKGGERAQRLNHDMRNQALNKEQNSIITETDAQCWIDQRQRAFGEMHGKSDTSVTDQPLQICNKWMTSFTVMFRVQNQFLKITVKHNTSPWGNAVHWNMLIYIYIYIHTHSRRISKIFNVFKEVSSAHHLHRLHLFDQKYSKKSNTVKYIIAI